MIRIADLYCGAGGETTGIVQALASVGGRYDLAAVNHWDVAIETHRHNHPQARHFLSDLQALNPHEVFGTTDRIDLLWASPECTHHSIARGGRPRSDQSRASAWLVLKWLSELYVRRVIIENVPEFLGWGPLGADGQPLKSRKGDTFRAFAEALQSLGYQVDWRTLCAADYGDPTTRRRLFVQAVRGRGRIEWPEPSHAQEPGLFNLKPWRPAREIIDWSIRGESILDRRRPLAPATLRRIEAGIRRFWGEWAEPFLVVLRGTSTTASVDDPLPTVTAGGGHFGLVEPFVLPQSSEGTPRSVDDPLNTVTTTSRGIGLIEPFLVPFYGERKGQDPRAHRTGEPVPTIPASGGGKFGVVEPFILSAGGPECKAKPVSDPVGTVLTRDHRAIVQPFILHQCSPGRPRSDCEPLPTILSRSGHGLVEGDLVRLDITFRMLQPHELAAAQGFPTGYWFAGNKTDQVKQIGNAVPPGTAKALVLAALSA